MLSAIVRFFFGAPTSVDQVLAPLRKAQDDLDGVISLRGAERDYKVNQMVELQSDIDAATNEISLALRVKANLAGLLN